MTYNSHLYTDHSTKAWYLVYISRNIMDRVRKYAATSYFIFNAPLWDCQCADYP